MQDHNVRLEPYGQDGSDGAGTAFRVIGILIWILGAIGGVLMLVAMGQASSSLRSYSYGYGSNDITAILAGGGIAAAIAIWIIAFISGLSFFGFGEVIKLLAKNATKKYQLVGDLSTLVPQQSAPMQASPAQSAPVSNNNAAPAREPVRFSWKPAAGTAMICPVCGCQQESLVPFCRQCGVQFIYPEG